MKYYGIIAENKRVKCYGHIHENKFLFSKYSVCSAALQTLYNQYGYVPEMLNEIIIPDGYNLLDDADAANFTYSIEDGKIYLLGRRNAIN